jgi:uncharacterized membrane protein YdjX (TVP38/TMEM64 family)
MRELVRLLVLVGLALLVPIVPFLGLGHWLDQRVEAWLDPPPRPGMVALAVVALLSTDVLLPIPSSVVSTVAGAQLGVLPATLVSWLGMTLGAALGFALAKAFGRPLAERLSSGDDLRRLDRFSEAYGAGLLVATRALPILAEAAVLLLGATRLPWRKFWPPILLANLGIAAVYSGLGHVARGVDQFALALAVSIALPLAATALVRWLLPRPANPTPSN